MGHKYTEIAFTGAVQEIQEQRGSRERYQRFEDDVDRNQHLTPKESDFISDRDSFYLASVSESGWPYVQHRGGPRGFVKVLDDGTIGYADFRGNRQYISVGNILHQDRVSIIFMDYANRRRLKLFGHASITEDSAVCQQLAPLDYRANIEQAFIIKVSGYDWNCPQHITRRYSELEWEQLSAAT